MGTIEKVQPVKLVCPALARDEQCFKTAENVLQVEFGPVDLTSETWDFDCTDYYKSEMGEGLKRRIYSFREPVDPAELAGIKVFTNQQEQGITDQLNAAPGRAINLDPGYVCDSKLILATTKDYSHRIYLREGIFAEITLQWHKSGFKPLQTTYPDYRMSSYRQFFALVRAVYREQMQELS